MRKDKTPEKSAARKFYVLALSLLAKNNISFMIGGTYAFNEYTGMHRSTKDLDIFCKAGDYLHVLEVFQNAAYGIEITDARWLAKIFSANKKHFIDIIFGSRTDVAAIDDTWFTHAPVITVLDTKVRLLPVEEMIWTKIYRMEKEKFDGADVMHLLLRCGKSLDWKRLLLRTEAHWELFFSYLVLFRFVYPSERENIPQVIIDEYIKRLEQQSLLPIPQDKVSRGHLLSTKDYAIDAKEWGFKDSN